MNTYLTIFGSATPYLQLIIGLVLLVVAGNYLVEAATGIAKFFKLSTLVIGMTIVAMGTSAPELLVSITAGLNGSPAIAIGNVVGSNSVNASVIVGLTALICPFLVSRQSIVIDSVFLFLLSVAMIVFGLTGDGLNRWEALVMFIAVIAFTVWEIKKARKQQGAEAEKEETPVTKEKSIGVNVLILLLSLVVLSFGADQMVNGATQLATAWGVSQRIISVTIVAIGTSLPELTASVVSAIKKQPDLTIGNIIGSNIMNIGIVLSSACMCSDIHFGTGAGTLTVEQYVNDSLWMIGFQIMLVIGMINVTGNVHKYKTNGKPQSLLSANDGKVGRIWGFCALALYATYVYLLLTR